MNVMNLEQCQKCEFHIDHRADSVLCKYNYEIEHRVLNGDKIVGCPLMDKKKKR